MKGHPRRASRCLSINALNFFSIYVVISSAVAFVGSGTCFLRVNIFSEKVCKMQTMYYI
jgi:hypothetical protein